MATVQSTLKKRRRRPLHTKAALGRWGCNWLSVNHLHVAARMGRSAERCPLDLAIPNLHKESPYARLY